MIRRVVGLILITVGFMALGTGVLLFDSVGQASSAAHAAPAKAAPQAALNSTASVTEGGYLVYLALGCGCHFNPVLGGLAGGEDFSSPEYGELYARNITPHPETGIGNYTPAQLETVLRTGKRPNGEQLMPVMPYPLFSGIAEDDMDDLIQFLLVGQTPISNTVPPRDLLFAPEPFTPTVPPPATAPVSGTARGEYIVTVLGDCVSCHGPNLAGTPGFAPNITSDPDFGLGSLTAPQIANMLQTGNRPTITDSVRFDGSPIGDIMGLIIQTAIVNWTPEDALAVAEYLLTVEPVGNQPPLFGSQPIDSARVGTSYVYSVHVADIDVGDTITVSAVVKPDWLELGPTNGPPRPTVGTAVLQGSATLSDVGKAPVVLVVSDSSGAMATQTFTVSVDAVLPIDGVALPILITEDEALEEE